MCCHAACSKGGWSGGLDQSQSTWGQRAKSVIKPELGLIASAWPADCSESITLGTADRLGLRTRKTGWNAGVWSHCEQDSAAYPLVMAWQTACPVDKGKAFAMS